MSKLSELLPAGAGAKSAEFVASGTLASGVTVALKSNGQVEAIAETNFPAETTTPTTFTTNTIQFFLDATYDSANNKVVVAYTDGSNSNYGTAVVGTVSSVDNSISFGSPVVFDSLDANEISIAYDENAEKIVIAYYGFSSPNTGLAIVGTVSGTSISFGSRVTMNPTGPSVEIGIVYAPDQQKVVCSYRDQNNSNYGTAIVGTVSGTSISFGTEVVFNSGQTLNGKIGYDTTKNRVLCAYRDNSNSNYGTIVVGTVSGTSISFGSENYYLTAYAAPREVIHDSVNNKNVIFYGDGSQHALAKVATLDASNNSLTFGAQATVKASSIGSSGAGAFNVAAAKIDLIYMDEADSDKAKLVTGTVSGTTISFTSETTVDTNQTDYFSVVYNTTLKNNFIAYADKTNTQGEAFVNQLAFTDTNSSSFVGITDQVIANTATGAVIVQGGAISGISLPLAPVLGTKTAFSSVQSQYVKSTFDSSNNKTVTVYINNNNYGTAVVGTVSGLSVSFGTPVIFNSNNTADTCATFDTNYNKVFISYTNYSGFPQGRVGTVSGTSISFGSENAFINSACVNVALTFDSNLNKVVVAYADSGNSGYAKSQVITLDGGASPGFSYGTAVVFNSKNTEYISSTFDSSNNKVVLSYAASTNANGVRVGTVSGSAISFGTELAFHAASQASYISSTFDTTNNKVVIFFAVGGANSTEAVVGTVSGTSITLGTQVRVGNSTSSNFTGVCFDSTQNKIMLAYRGTVGGTQLGRLAIGTVSGTSITVADAVTFNSAATAWNGPIFDSSAKKTVIFFQDTTGYAIVVSLTTEFTIGTDYFVQSDGSLSTTSSTVPAGRALSTTSMLLEG